MADGERPHGWKRHTYTPLGSTSSIRLLRWQQRANINGYDRVYELIEVSLENVPAYEALSYAWGSRDLRPAVRIGDSYVFVTLSCFHALRHLPKTVWENGKRTVSWFEGQTRYIWIDAICINQDSIRERNQQVSIMSEIYRRAQRVLVWLDITSIDPDLPLDIHAGVASEAFKMNNVELTRWKNPVNVGQEAVEEAQKRYKKTIYRVADELEQLLQRPWFRRVWILQEVAVAQSIELFNGDSTYGGISWDDFEIATETQYNAQQHEVKDFFQAAMDIIKLRRAYQEHQSINMAGALSMARASRATDSRDKVFALLGLCEELRLLEGPADYSKSAKDVWMNACRSWLQSDPALIMLRSATKPPPVPSLILNTPEFPSWVPSVDEVFPMWYTKPRPLQLVHGHALISFSDDELYIKGAIVDSIEFAFNGDVLPDTDHKMWQKWHNWITTELGGTLLYATGEAILVNCWRTVFQDVEHRIELSEELEHWTQWFISEIQCNIIGLDFTNMVDRDASDFPINGDNKVSIAMLRKRTRHKALFRTEGNYLGIATQALREDDVIAVFSGCGDPYILRECFVDVSETSSQQLREKRYTLIGPAYVHGIMDGEAHSKAHDLYETLTIC